jgi:hypothetical protein
MSKYRFVITMAVAAAGYGMMYLVHAPAWGCVLGAWILASWINQGIK